MNEERDGTDDVRGQHLITVEQKTRDACQGRRCEKDCRPTIGSLGTQHRDCHDDAGHDTDQADHNVNAGVDIPRIMMHLSV